MASSRTFHLNPKELATQIAYWPRVFSLIWEAAPRWTVAWAILLVLQGMLPVASVYLTKLLVDSLVSVSKAPDIWVYARPTMLLFAAAAGVMILGEFLQGISEWVRASQSELVQDHIKGLVHTQTQTVDLTFFESSEFFDKLDRARNEAGGRSLALLESSGSLVQNFITLLAMGAVLVAYSPWIPIILLAGTLPAFYVIVHFDRQYHRWWERRTADRRWSQYYDHMLTEGAAAAEMRLFGLGPHFQRLYRNLRRTLRDERLNQIKRQGFGKLMASLAAFTVAGATMAWMVWRSLQGIFTLGDLALFYQAFSRGQGLMRSLLGSAGQILTNSLFLGNLFTFLDIKPALSGPEDPAPTPKAVAEGIAFRSVSFTYPGSDRPALNNFNLFIPAGKVVAIVGENGAGKSTLLKLLCRFFDPTSGEIEVDGVNLRSFAINDLWRLITVLFQYPLNYHATAWESIALSDIGSKPSLVEVEEAARKAGAHEVISRLPKGYDTLLGKWFADGVQLSGGECQRVALARAYLRKSPIILLDEPTSFMDSWTETEWFNNFRATAQGRTAVVITHRFTIAMRADIIHVMKGGMVVESGSHSALLRLKGLYAQSWESQMEAANSGKDREDGVAGVYSDDMALWKEEVI